MGCALEEPDCVRNLELAFWFHFARVLLLEGLAEDLGQLGGSCGGVCTHDEVRLFSQEVAKVLVLGDCLLHVMCDGQQAQPVGDKVSGVSRVALYKSGLVLDDLTDRSDGVVTGVVVHLELILLV